MRRFREPGAELYPASPRRAGLTSLQTRVSRRPEAALTGATREDPRLVSVDDRGSSGLSLAFIPRGLSMSRQRMFLHLRDAS